MDTNNGLLNQNTLSMDYVNNLLSCNVSTSQQQQMVMIVLINLNLKNVYFSFLLRNNTFYSRETIGHERE